MPHLINKKPMNNHQSGSMLMLAHNHYWAVLLILCLFMVTACTQHNSDGASANNSSEMAHTDTSAKDAKNAPSLIQRMTIKQPIDERLITFKQRYYVPIYSDSYVDSHNPKNLFSATLSIHNTSQTDSLYVTSINYYNTHGELVSALLTKPLELKPLATFNHIIAKEDDTGGSGANFIVDVSAKNHTTPVMQALMIGYYGNKSFSFIVDGVPLLKQPPCTPN